MAPLQWCYQHCWGVTRADVTEVGCNGGGGDQQPPRVDASRPERRVIGWSRGGTGLGWHHSKGSTRANSTDCSMQCLLPQDYNLRNTLCQTSPGRMRQMTRWVFGRAGSRIGEYLSQLARGWHDVRRWPWHIIMHLAIWPSHWSTGQTFTKRKATLRNIIGTLETYWNPWNESVLLTTITSLLQIQVSSLVLSVSGILQTPHSKICEKSGKLGIFDPVASLRR